MYTLQFNDFMDADKFPSGNLVLYVVRNKSNILYVGISKSGIWNRWFGSRGRLTKNIYDEWLYTDSISSFIVKNMPQSLKYSIDLWTIEECRDFLSITDTHLRDVENSMIADLFPSINFINNTRSNFPVGIKVKEYMTYIKLHKQIYKNKVLQSTFSSSNGLILPEEEIPF